MAMALPFGLDGSAPVAGASIELGSSPRVEKALFVSGGAAQAGTVEANGPSGFGLASAWGVVSIVYILMKAISRLAPIAFQPFSRVSPAQVVSLELHDGKLILLVKVVVGSRVVCRNLTPPPRTVIPVGLCFLRHPLQISATSVNCERLKIWYKSAPVSNRNLDCENGC